MMHTFAEICGAVGAILAEAFLQQEFLGPWQWLLQTQDYLSR
jgi:hypothetical protein